MQMSPIASVASVAPSANTIVATIISLGSKIDVRVDGRTRAQSCVPAKYRLPGHAHVRNFVDKIVVSAFDRAVAFPRLWFPLSFGAHLRV